MRKLTIERKKSFVGCLARMKVYIEDSVNSELTLNGVPARKLGELKNGETREFEIPNEASRIFVIADTVSKDYCNEFYVIPDGEEDVFLSGRNRFNPAAGNAFRFDGNDSAEVLANRKKGTSRGLVILLIAILVGGLAGFFIGKAFVSGFINTEPREKVFEESGLHITLTDAFRKESYPPYTVCFDSKDVAVFALREEFTLYEGLEDYSLKDYGEAVMLNNSLDPKDLIEKDGLTYFTFDFVNTENSKTYAYYAFLYKTHDSFWMIQFATLKDSAEKLLPDFIQWAKSADFPMGA